MREREECFGDWKDWVGLRWALPCEYGSNYCLHVPEEYLYFIMAGGTTYISEASGGDRVISLDTSIQMAEVYGRKPTFRDGVCYLPIYLSEAYPGNVTPGGEREGADRREMRVLIPTFRFSSDLSSSVSDYEWTTMRKRAIKEIHMSFLVCCVDGPKPPLPPCCLSLCDSISVRFLNSCLQFPMRTLVGTPLAFIFWFGTAYSSPNSMTDVWTETDLVRPVILSVEMQLDYVTRLVFPSSDFVCRRGAKGKPLCWMIPLVSEFRTFSDLKHWRDHGAPVDTPDKSLLPAGTKLLVIRFVSDPTVSCLRQDICHIPIHLAFLTRYIK